MSMVKGNPIELFKRFRFLLSVGDQTHGIMVAKDTVHGLELGSAHFPDKPSIMGLFRELPGDAMIDIVMVSRVHDGPERRIRYHLGLDEDRGEAIHLAIDLDSAQDGPAYERVLLPRARLVDVIDTKCPFVPEPKPLELVFDGPPGPEGPRFIEAEIDGKSVNAGEWVERPDGLWILRIER